MRRIVLSLALLFVLAGPALADGSADPVVAADHSEAAGSAAGSAVTTPPPADAVSDPLEHPAQAYDQAKAAKREGWAVLVFFCLVALTKALAYGRDKLAGMPVIGWAAARLAKGKTAMIVAGIGAVAAAGYNILADGGTLGSALIAAGVALAGALHSTTHNA